MPTLDQVKIMMDLAIELWRSVTPDFNMVHVVYLACSLWLARLVLGLVW